MIKSYTTEVQGFFRTVQEGFLQWGALRHRVRNIKEEIEQGIRFHDTIIRQAESMTAISLEGLKVLEVGHGQMPMAAAFIAARGNEVHGIDLDVLPSGLLDLQGYTRLFLTNGFSRALKTFARELTGINQSVRAEFMRQMGLRRWPRLYLRQASATSLPYADNSFDFIFSFHVFEHIDDPASAIAESIRVLRPGGGLFFMFPHYAHANALHDIRVITGASDAPQPWAHLIPELRSTVRQGAFVNTLTLSQWQELVMRRCPGAHIATTLLKSPTAHEKLAMHRAAGWLSNFSDEELLTDDLVVGWRKPVGG